MPYSTDFLPINTVSDFADQRQAPRARSPWFDFLMRPFEDMDGRAVYMKARRAAEAAAVSRA